MIRLVVLQHEPETGLGRLAGLLDDHGVDYEVLRTTRDPLPDAMAFDAAMVLGGSLAADDATLRPARRWVRDAVLGGMPYLGICLGGQLLASALGAAVRRGGAEAGGHRVFLTDAAERDPLFGELPGGLDVFGWHRDSFELPRGAVPLAGSLACTYQAFRYATAAYGLQFHLEVRPGDISRWRDVAGYREVLEQSGRDWDDVVDDLARLGPGLEELAPHLLARWLYLAAGVVALPAIRSVPA